jgi:hypothetical protein
MRVKIHDSSIGLWASSSDTYDWAHKIGAEWPCSTLSGKRFFAAFDSNGLCDLSVNGQASDKFDIDSNELSAICSDLLSAKLDHSHPVWLIAVGQCEIA